MRRMLNKVFSFNKKRNSLVTNPLPHTSTQDKIVILKVNFVAEITITYGNNSHFKKLIPSRLPPRNHSAWHIQCYTITNIQYTKEFKVNQNIALLEGTGKDSQLQSTLI